jgi:aminoglycoside phosphotransferase (APT) family kinase protein
VNTPTVWAATYPLVYRDGDRERGDQHARLSVPPAWSVKPWWPLKAAYDELPRGLPKCVVHGDVWSGNVVTTADRAIVLLDLERCSVGPPEWDLVSMAVAHVTTAGIDTKEWAAYCETYGHDVTTWEGFEVLRDIRELRQTTMAVQVATTAPERYADQAAHPARVLARSARTTPLVWLAGGAIAAVIIRYPAGPRRACVV